MQLTYAEQSVTTDTVHQCIPSESLKSLGIHSYDNGYVNTAVCHSQITYIDGDKGILRYRGYDIEALAASSNFLEVSYLLIHGELPLSLIHI